MTTRLEFLSDDADGLQMAPIIVVGADANIVLQIDFLQVLERTEVDGDLRQSIVVERHNFQSMIAFEEVRVDCLETVVRCLEALEHRRTRQKIRRQSSQLIVFDKEVHQFVEVVEQIFGDFCNFIVLQVQSLQLWHAREVIARDKFHTAVGDDVLDEIWEEDASIEAGQIRRATISNPNVLDIAVGVSVLVLARDRSDSYVRRVDVHVLDLATVQTARMTQILSNPHQTGPRNLL